MKLSAIQRDRAAGLLLATAAGDALGAPFEFGPPLGPSVEVAMTGGGPWEPGEWTDDTSMAIAIAEVAADNLDLRSDAATDRVVTRWAEWARRAKDVGIQTRQVLGSIDQASPTSSARAAATAVHRRTGRSGGNGSLMRTAPVTLAYLDDVVALAEAARSLSTLTHHDPEAGEACVLWCLAIRHAVLTGDADVRVGLTALPGDRAAVWLARIETAVRSTPADFPNNGWVVEALQGAWSAIATTAVAADDPTAARFRADHVRLAIDAAVRGGHDTDTVAAIAGGLVGAAYGASAVPWEWRRVLHGWPGLTGRDLVVLTDSIVNGPDTYDFRYSGHPPVGVLGRHPDDDGLWLGGVAGLVDLPPDVDAVVSLCRVSPLPAVSVVVEARLIDAVGANAHVDFALLDAVRAVEALRAEGRVVYLHCVAAQSRTPTVAALYGMRRRGIDAVTALSDVRRVIPAAAPNPDFRAALARLAAIDRQEGCA